MDLKATDDHNIGLKTTIDKVKVEGRGGSPFEERARVALRLEIYINLINMDKLWDCVHATHLFEENWGSTRGKWKQKRSVSKIIFHGSTRIYERLIKAA